MSNIQYLTEKEVSKKFNISKATIKNWIKQGHLEFYNDKGFAYDDVETLQGKIAIGNDKLNSRANKNFSNKTFIPIEYITLNKNKKDIARILFLYKKMKLEIDELLLYISYRILELNDLIAINEENVLFLNSYLETDIEEFFPVSNFSKSKYKAFLWMKGKFQEDFLGCVYQSLKMEGDKSSKGSYYTPEFLVESIVSEIVLPESRVLDPCCGTGQFLIKVSKIVRKPENVWGFDIDSLAVGIARINIHLQYPEKEFNANIFCKNTLTENSNQNLFNNFKRNLFDIVLTNPPWGASLSEQEIKLYKKLYPQISTKESFSYFILKGLSLLKKGGKLIYILPESFLWVKKHSEIREYILKNTTIKAVFHLGRIFKGVFSPVVRIDLINEKPSGNMIFSRSNNQDQYLTDQQLLLSEKDYKYNVFLSRNSRDIIMKMYEKSHITLENNAVWALGIVTGDNKKHLLKSKVVGSEPIFKGAEVSKYKLKRNEKFIKFEPNLFQQVAPEYVYRAKEKLVYRFISKELIFAYDNKGLLTLNSANVLIPKLNDYPIKTILALFNSKVYQFLFQNKFNTIKVLRGDLEQLPLPLLTDKDHSIIENLVNEFLESNNRKQQEIIRDDLEAFIINIFNFTKKEVDLIYKFKVRR
jgi:type I restriction-modification system DNA methylase subunit